MIVIMHETLSSKFLFSSYLFTLSITIKYIFTMDDTDKLKPLSYAKEFVINIRNIDFIVILFLACVYFIHC